MQRRVRAGRFQRIQRIFERGNIVGLTIAHRPEVGKFQIGCTARQCDSCNQNQNTLYHFHIHFQLWFVSNYFVTTLFHP